MKQDKMEVIAVIGAEAKRRRLLNLKRLNDRSCGCSLSYLSKFENGKVVPKYKMLMEICESQGILKEELDAMLSIEEAIKECVADFFYNRNSKINYHYQKIVNLNNYKANFIKAFYELSFLHYDKVWQILCECRPIKDEMSLYDKSLLAYFEMLCELHNNNYLRIIEIKKGIELINGGYLEVLIYKAFFEGLCHLGLENPTMFYRRLLEYYYNLNYTDYKLEKRLYLETCILEGLELNPNVIDSLDQRNYFLYLFKKKDLNLLLKYKEKYSFSNAEELLYYYLKSDYKSFIKYYNRLNILHLDPVEALFINYLNIDIMDDYEKMYDFLVMDGLPFAKKRQSNYLYSLFIKKLIKISFEVGKYKPVMTEVLLYEKFVKRGKVCTL